MVKYRGGKSKELNQLMPFVPDTFSRYVEPFLGGGALYFALEPKNAVINDINSKLMGFYSGVRDNFCGVMAELLFLEQQYEKNRKEFEQLKCHAPGERVPDANEGLYYHVRDMYNGKAQKKYSDAALYYFINKTAYSGMIRHNKRGEYNVPYGRYKNFNTRIINEKHSELLKKAELSAVDYQVVFDRAEPDDFVFLDPPYDCVFSDYGNPETPDGFNEAQHRRLADAFYRLPCKALMVIGKTPLTHELYRNSIVDEYAKLYAVNIRNRFKSASQHILIANY
jgi:DNA adenine methylase